MSSSTNGSPVDSTTSTSTVIPTTRTFVFTDLEIDFSNPKETVIPDFWQLVEAHKKWSLEVKGYDDEESDNETIVGGSCSSGSEIDMDELDEEMEAEDFDVSMICEWDDEIVDGDQDSYENDCTSDEEEE